MVEPIPEPLMTWRFFRTYAVRIVIGAVLVASASIAVFSWVPYQREQRIARKIEAFDGTVVWQYNGPKWIPKAVHDRLRLWHRIESVGLREFVSDMHGNYDGETTIKTVPLDLLGDIGTLACLKVLFAKHTDVDDDGLKHLSELTALEDLDLEGTRITDRGLEHLKSMQNLKYLILVGTGVSENGKESLQMVLPDCDIRLEPFFLL